jgi:hypothetical protein
MDRRKGWRWTSHQDLVGLPVELKIQQRYALAFPHSYRRVRFHLVELALSRRTDLAPPARSAPLFALLVSALGR